MPRCSSSSGSDDSGHSRGSLDPHPRSEASRAGTLTSSRSACEWPAYRVCRVSALLGLPLGLLCQCFEISRQLLSCCIILVTDLAEELLWSRRKKSCISFVACTINWKCCFQNYSQRKNAKKLVSTQILQIRIRENLKFICNGKAWWVLKMAIR